MFDFKADKRFFAFSTANIVPLFFIYSGRTHVFIPGDAARYANIEPGKGFRIFGGSIEDRDWIENNPKFADEIAERRIGFAIINGVVTFDGKFENWLSNP